MIEAVGFRVLIKPDPIIEKTKGGLVLALDTKLEKGATVTGTVVHIGPEAWCSHNRAAGSPPDRPWVSVGDHIYYAKYAGKWVTDPDDPETDYLMINDEDVVGKLTNAGNTDNLAP